MPFEILDWDTNHFGFKVARLVTDSEAEAREAFSRCEAEDVKMMIIRCGTDNIRLAQFFESAGCRLMDTLVQYELEIRADTPIEFVSPAKVRSFRKDEVEAIASIAAAAFESYIDHFHADPLLPKEKSDALYIEWARNSCFQPHLADDVLVAVIDDKVIGFATMKAESPEVAEGVLFAVSPEGRGKGVYSDMIAGGMGWCREKGIARMRVATQINNYAVQRAWVKHGFRLMRSNYTFHYWR